MANKFSEVLVSLKSITEKELTKKMFENNMKHSRWFSYTDPVFANGNWVTWFMADLELGFGIELPDMTPEPIKVGA